MANETVGMATRGELADHVAAFIQDTGTIRRTMILRDLDEAYREALRKYEWPQLLRWADVDIQALNNVPYFFTEKNIRTVLGFIDSTTPFRVQEHSLYGLLDHSAGFTQIQGVPSNVAHAGDFGIKLLIDPATALEVVSSGADTRPGWVKGMLNGELKQVNFTLNGAVAVSVGTWDEVYEFSLNTVSTTLTVTIRKVTGSVTAGVISPDEVQAIYRRYRLYTVPSGNRPYRIVYKYTPPQIFSETHQYVIPVQDYLKDFAIARGYQSRRQNDLAQEHLGIAEASLMKVWEETKGNRVDVSVPEAALMRMTQGAGIIINAYGYR